MPLQVITNPQFCSPSAANSPSVAAAGVAWTNTGWVQIAATTDVVWILTSIIAWCSSGAISTIDFEIDIGIKIAGVYTVIDTVCGRHKPQGVAVCTQPIRRVIPIDGLNGDHAFRIRTSGTRTDTWNVAVTHLKNPISGTLLITRSPGLVYPPAAAPIALVASGSTWVNGTAVELVAATATDIVIPQLMLHIDSSTNVEAEVDLVTGASLNTVVSSIPINAGNTISGAPCLYEFPNPLDNIPAGTRVGMVMRASVGSATAKAKAMYHAKPL